MDGVLVSTFHARQDKNYWVIDSGCLNHMIKDKVSLLNLKSMMEDYSCLEMILEQKLLEKGIISFDGKHSTNDFYYVKGLRHNLLSVR
jgi:hypothetical protein